MPRGGLVSSICSTLGTTIRYGSYLLSVVNQGQPAGGVVYLLFLVYQGQTCLWLYLLSVVHQGKPEDGAVASIYRTFGKTRLWVISIPGGEVVFYICSTL